MKIGLIPFIILFVFIATSIGHAADSNSLSVTATVVSRGSCQFTTQTSALNFGSLDPSNPIDVNRNTSVSFRCFGFFTPVTYYIDDIGSYDIVNAHRMRHTSIFTEYLAYSLTLDPRSATISWNPFITHPVTITGTVRGVDYQNAMVGNYQDIVSLTIVP